MSVTRSFIGDLPDMLSAWRFENFGWITVSAFKKAWRQVNRTSVPCWTRTVKRAEKYLMKKRREGWIEMRPLEGYHRFEFKFAWRAQMFGDILNQPLDLSTYRGRNRRE